MILVHDTFVCKPGQASKAAKLFKEVMAKNPYLVNVMTDVTGQFHRVIMVSKYGSLAEFEKVGKEMMEKPSPEMKEGMKKMEGFHDMYLSGSREIYKVW
jgi:hypothetical protein